MKYDLKEILYVEIDEDEVKHLHLEKLSVGKVVILRQDGKEIAQIVPITSSKYPRVPGQYQGQVKIEPEFYEADADIETMVYGV